MSNYWKYRENTLAAEKQRRLLRKSLRLCTRCGNEDIPVDSEFVQCAACRAKNTKEAAERYVHSRRAATVRIRAERRVNGICPRCGLLSVVGTGFNYCKPCRDKSASDNRIRRAKLKEQRNVQLAIRTEEETPRREVVQTGLSGVNA